MLRPSTVRSVATNTRCTVPLRAPRLAASPLPQDRCIDADTGQEQQTADDQPALEREHVQRKPDEQRIRLRDLRAGNELGDDAEIHDVEARRVSPQPSARKWIPKY